MHEKHKFPSQLEPNLKSQQHHQISNIGNQNIHQVKSVIILRGGKFVEKHVLNPREISEEPISVSKKELSNL